MQPAVEKRMTLGEHLEELRRRVIYSLLFIVVAVSLCFAFQDRLMGVVCRPHVDAMRSVGAPEKLYLTQYPEAILNTIKLSLICGVMLAAPVVILELWLFVRAGLHPGERKYVGVFFLPSLVLFAGGVAFGYFLLIPTTLKFLSQYGTEAFQPIFTLDGYLGLFLTLTLLMGLLFELPLIMLFLSKLGLISSGGFASKRKFAILAAFVLSAVLTPTPDPVTQTVVAIPLWFLYELGILLAYLFGRKAGRIAGA
jgi:sec-independent protein translocase protein TatC